MLEETVHIGISKARALVLYEFLSRFIEDKGLVIQDQAEERVLWDLQCDLESSHAATPSQLSSVTGDR